MKTYIYLFAFIGITATACNEVVENPIIDDPKSEFEILIENMQGEVDDALLLETLHTKGLESTAYRVSADSDETSESLIRYIFNEDGTCQLFSTLDDLRVNYTSSYGEKNIGVCSRIFDWNYDEETNTITTSDEYGGIYEAQILYFDGATLCYIGNVGGELTHEYNPLCIPNTTEGFEVCRIVSIVDNRDTWLEDTIHFDNLFYGIVDPRDRQYNRIVELCNMDVEINDDAFVERLLNSTLNFNLVEDNGITECIYPGGMAPRLYMISKDGTVWSNHDMPLKGYSVPALSVMMEDGSCRECIDYAHLYTSDTESEYAYTLHEWEYDAETNTLITKHGQFDYDPLHISKAVVLYFDGDIAILRGHVLGFPRIIESEETYLGLDGLFYIDLNVDDRTSVLEKYDNLVDL